MSAVPGDVSSSPAPLLAEPPSPNPQCVHFTHCIHPVRRNGAGGALPPSTLMMRPSAVGPRAYRRHGSASCVGALAQWVSGRVSGHAACNALGMPLCEAAELSTVLAQVDGSADRVSYSAFLAACLSARMTLGDQELRSARTHAPRAPRSQAGGGRVWGESTHSLPVPRPAIVV